MSKHLSIIITHHKTSELLYLCIKSIKDTTREIKPEIIIVDSESDYKTKELIRDNFKKIKLIPFKKNLGYSKIVNRGIEKANGKYILILNADIIVLKHSIDKMISYMDKNPDVGILGPQLIDFTNNIQISCFSNPGLKAIIARRTFLGKTKWGKRILKKFTIKNWDRKSKREVDWVQGSAMMIRKDAVDKIGLFDEKFFMYLEDADLCRRFWNNNYKVVYYPEAKMAHYYHRASKKWGPFLDVFLNKYARTHIISAVKYFWKWKYAK